MFRISFLTLTDDLDLKPITLEYHIDLLISILALCIYFIAVWIPTIIVYFYMCFKVGEDTTKLAKEWKRLNKAYRYLDVWFRTHIIVFICIIIADAFESQENHWDELERFVLLGSSLFLCLLLYVAIKLLRRRIWAIKEQISYQNILESDQFDILDETSFKRNRKLFSTFFKQLTNKSDDFSEPLLEAKTLEAGQSKYNLKQQLQHKSRPFHISFSVHPRKSKIDISNKPQSPYYGHSGGYQPPTNYEKWTHEKEVREMANIPHVRKRKTKSIKRIKTDNDHPGVHYQQL